MNVTELARKLNTDKDKLLKILPKYGYDIGKKAIKIDDNVAQQVMEEWSDIKADLEKKKKKKQEKIKQKKKEIRKQQADQREIELPESITVKNLSEKMGMPVSELISHLMDEGILANKNQELDYDTASIVAEELDYDVQKKDTTEVDAGGEQHGQVLRESLEESDNLERRPPVIIVMGHVDHGKTRLLDTIREKNMIDQEAGSITQHIGAYQAVWEDPEDEQEKKMTFIDTPGHKAFTVMRSRGAKVADIAILVVAADDGVQPQTKEAIQIMKAADLPFVVAINKIDKNDIDIERTKKQLSEEDVIPEEWGGDTPMVEISAKQKTNIDDLLDMILLVSDMNEDEIQADENVPAVGTVIESHKDKQMGSVATILIQNGSLETADPLIINGSNYGNVRRMWNHKGEDIEVAGPSVPAQMIGFDVTPEVGDILDVSKADQAEKVDAREKEMEQTGAQSGTIDSGESEDKNTLNLYVKADVLGSLEALVSTLEEVEHEEVGVKIAGKGLGNITVDDVNKAEAGNAALVGFQVEPTYSAEELIQDKDLDVKTDDVIYDITEWVKDQLEDLLETETIVEKTGNLKVLAIFSEESRAMTIGGRVETGFVKPGVKAKVKRGGEVVGEGKVANLKQGQQDVEKIKAGKECGVRFEGKTEVKEGDVLDFYKTETKEKSLDME